VPPLRARPAAAHMLPALPDARQERGDFRQQRLMRRAVAEVGGYRSDDGLPVVLHEALELLQVGATLGKARLGMRQVGRPLALQGVAQGAGDRALGVLRIGLHFAAP